MHSSILSWHSKQMIVNESYFASKLRHDDNKNRVEHFSRWCRWQALYKLLQYETAYLTSANHLFPLIVHQVLLYQLDITTREKFNMLDSDMFFAILIALTAYILLKRKLHTSMEHNVPFVSFKVSVKCLTSFLMRHHVLIVFYHEKKNSPFNQFFTS